MTSPQATELEGILRHTKGKKNMRLRTLYDRLWTQTSARLLFESDGPWVYGRSSPYGEKLDQMALDTTDSPTKRLMKVMADHENEKQKAINEERALTVDHKFDARITAVEQSKEHGAEQDSQADTSLSHNIVEQQVKID